MDPENGNTPTWGKQGSWGLEHRNTAYCGTICEVTLLTNCLFILSEQKYKALSLVLQG